MEREAWIIDAVRSPRGKGKKTGSLHGVHPQRVLAQVMNALRDRNGFDTAEVDDVVIIMELWKAMALVELTEAAGEDEPC